MGQPGLTVYPSNLLRYCGFYPSLHGQANLPGFAKQSILHILWGTGFTARPDPLGCPNDFISPTGIFIVKFNLRIQVFLAFAFFAVLLTGGLYLYSRLSFERGFTQYIEQKETARNARLIQALERHYRMANSWDVFKINTNYWELFVWQYTINIRERERPIPFPLPPELNSFDLDRPDQFFFHRDTRIRRERSAQSPEDFLRNQPYKRFILLNAKEELIAGKKWRNETYLYSNLVINNGESSQTVGYLGVPLNPALRDLRDNEFAKRQQNHFLIMTMVALIIALGCAIPLSFLLTQRVKRLANHVQRLSRGDYQQRLAINGHDEISILAEHLNHLAHTLDQTEQARKRWVADISHELRTPLAVLRADLEALEDGVRKFDQKAVARLHKHAGRLASLINDLYQLSLTDIGAMSYRKQTCDLAEIIEEIANSLQDKLTQAGLVLEQNLNKESPIVFADPERLQQLFLNLFNNSINYTESPGRIKIALSKENNSAIFTIEDSAPGVDPELHEKLFERLYRAESSRSRETGGAGLGLSICRNIVEAHEGHIQIESSELGGLKISVSLPLQVSA